MTASSGVRRLYKSRTDRMLDGVCGGVGEFFGLDPTLVRIAWVLAALFGGSGILLYLVAMIIMPVNPGEAAATPGGSHHRNTRFWGILLIVVGGVWFLDNLGVPFWHNWWGFSWDVFLPVLLILAGVAFIYGGRNSLTTSSVADTPSAAPAGSVPPTLPAVRLTRSRGERKLFGVCGGIASYLSTDPTIIRLLVIIATFASFGFMLLLYVLMAIVVPEEPAVVKP